MGLAACMIFNLWEANIGWIPTISELVQVNLSKFFNSSPYTYSLSLLDRRLLTYVNYSGPSNTTISKGSMSNGSLSSALIWAAACDCYAGL